METERWNQTYFTLMSQRDQTKMSVLFVFESSSLATTLTFHNLSTTSGFKSATENDVCGELKQMEIFIKSKTTQNVFRDVPPPKKSLVPKSRKESTSRVKNAITRWVYLIARRNAVKKLGNFNVLEVRSDI